MLIMVKQRRRQTATERTPFAPFAGTVLTASDQRVVGIAAALMPSQSSLSAPRLGDCEAAVSLAAPQPEPCPPAGSTPPGDAQLH
jgi:hypothetical protein